MWVFYLEEGSTERGFGPASCTLRQEEVRFKRSRFCFSPFLSVPFSVLRLCQAHLTEDLKTTSLSLSSTHSCPRRSKLRTTRNEQQYVSGKRRLARLSVTQTAPLTSFSNTTPGHSLVPVFFCLFYPLQCLPSAPASQRVETLGSTAATAHAAARRRVPPPRRTPTPTAVAAVVPVTHLFLPTTETGAASNAVVARLRRSPLLPSRRALPLPSRKARRLRSSRRARLLQSRRLSRAKRPLPKRSLPKRPLPTKSAPKPTHRRPTLVRNQDVSRTSNDRVKASSTHTTTVPQR